MIKKGLIVIVTQGFANRMRMLNSCYILSKILKIPLFVAWVKTDDCYIDYDNTFSEKNDFEKIDLEEIIKSNNYLYFGRVHTQNYLDKIDSVNNDMKVNYDFLILEGGHEFKHKSLTRLNFIKQKYNFYRSIQYSIKIENELKKHMKNELINNDLKTNVNEMKLSYNFKYNIGIHYRDLDHFDDLDISNNKLVNFVKNSPINNFFKIIDQLPNKSPILLVSNTNKIFYKLKDKYPNRDIKFIINEENCNRSSMNGMIKAIVDFLLLSKTKLIIGNYFSSFSDEASFYNLSPKITPLSKELLNDIKNTVNSYHCINYSYIDNIAALNYNDKIFCEYLNISNI